jgi:hypothetical protein
VVRNFIITGFPYSKFTQLGAKIEGLGESPGPLAGVEKNRGKEYFFENKQSPRGAAAYIRGGYYGKSQ